MTPQQAEVFADVVASAQAAQRAGFSRLCLKCLKGFDGEHCPYCPELRAAFFQHMQNYVVEPGISRDEYAWEWFQAHHHEFRD